MIILLLSMLMLTSCSPAFATEDVNPIVSYQKETIPVLNDELRKTTRRLRELENGISLTTGVTGILPVSKGGTGNDWSTVPANNIAYFSSTGTMGNIGVGTTGQYLTYGNPPNWTTPTSVPKLIHVENITAAIASGSSTTSTSTTIDSSGDWASKGIKSIGEICLSGTSCTGSSTSASDSYYSSSSTDLSGLLYGSHTCTGTAVVDQTRSFFTYGTNLPSVSESFGNGCSGSTSCVVSVSGGNLILTASRTADSGAASLAVNCELSGVFVREP